MTMFSGLFSQPAFQAIAAGLLSGAVAGTAIVGSGILPLEPQREDPKFVALLACPGGGPELARVPAGHELLITGRSEDGTWLEVYIGEPGVERAWAPAPALRSAAAIDALPVSACDTTQTFLPTLGPPESTDPPVTAVPGTIVPPTEVPTPGPTLPPGATPTPTPRPTPTPKITPSPKPTPTKTPTPKPPTPVPTAVPTLFIDQTAPTLTNLTNNGEPCNDGVRCIYRPSATCSNTDTVTVSVTATDPDDPVSAVMLYYRPVGGSVVEVFMTHPAGSDVWSGAISAQDSWNDGQVTYWVQAVDTHQNYTDPTYPPIAYELYMGICLF